MGKVRIVPFASKRIRLRTPKKADHRVSKTPFLDFLWTWLNIVDKLFPNDNYLVQKSYNLDNSNLPENMLQMIQLKRTTRRHLSGKERAIRRQNHLNKLAWKAKFGDPVFDTFIKKTDNMPRRKPYAETRYRTCLSSSLWRFEQLSKPGSYFFSDSPNQRFSNHDNFRQSQHPQAVSN